VYFAYAAITLSKWELLEQKRKEEEASARKQASSSYDDIDGRSVSYRVHLISDITSFAVPLLIYSGTLHLVFIMILLLFKAFC